LWSYDTPDGGLAGPAVSGGAVYVTDTRGSNVYAISTKTGELLWQSLTPTTDGQLGTTPVVADGHVYVGAAQYLLALSASTGKHAWATALPDHGLPFPSSPTAADGVVYEFVGDATEYAVSAATGKILWSYPGGTTNSTALHASPVVADGFLFMGTSSGSLISLRPR
jgi:outer membrane protein assembly factor BamB